jgi:hypothetical protein
MDKDYLLLKRAALSRLSGEWNDDDYEVLANGEFVGRIYKANAAPVGSPWMWTLAPRRSQPDARVCCDPRAAMAAFAKSWRRRLKRKAPLGGA